MLNNFVQRKEFFERRPEDHPKYGEEWKVGKKIGLLELVYLFFSVADPDPHSVWSAGSGSALGIRIRIQEGQNDPQK